MDYENEMLISAALDGERVDVAALRHALEVDEGRELLASFVLLRAEVAADDFSPDHPLRAKELLPVRGLPTEAVFSSTSRLAPQEPCSRKGFIIGPRARIAMAASVVMAMLLGSFWLGTAWRGHVAVPHEVQGRRSSSPTTIAKPEVSTELPAPHFRTPEPGASSFNRHSQDGSGAGPSKPTAEPPKPTRVLRFIPGKEWRAES